MRYITNKFDSIRLPVEEGLLEWLQAKYPASKYFIKETLWDVIPVVVQLNLIVIGNKEDVLINSLY